MLKFTAAMTKAFTRDVWNCKRAIYDLTKSKIKEVHVNWYELIHRATEINTACKVKVQLSVLV